MIALAATRPDWVVGCEDETWWSRVARPGLHAWSDADPPRLTALACYGLLVRSAATAEQMWVRFVDGRPVSTVTTQFLQWCCERLAQAGATKLVLVWDNAAWHVSKTVRRWLRDHNQQAHRVGGVRIVPCFLPTKSPWLNPIEPKWVHGKRRVVEPARLLTAREVEERVCAAFACARFDHLAIPQEVT